MEATTLHSLGRDVLFQFREVSLALRKEVPQQLEMDKTEQLIGTLTTEQERFQLWAANLGLQATGDRSLDYRMKDSSSIKLYTSQLLEELVEDLSDLCRLLAVKSDHTDTQQLQKDEKIFEFDLGGHAARRDLDDDASGDEQSDDDIAETQSITVESTAEAARVVLEDISDIIDRLYRLAAKLRSAANRAPPSARNFYREPLIGIDGEEYYLTSSERQIAKAQTEEFQLRRIEEIVRQSRRDESGDKFPRENKSPELDPQTKAVIQRIARGNAYRQQQFAFWRQREWDRRNAVNYQFATIRSPSILIGPGQESQELQEPGGADLNSPAKSKVAFSEVPSATWNMPKGTNLTLLDEMQSLSLKTEITMTPTVYEPSGRKVGWPVFPKELGKKKDFICPYCFTTCPAKYRGKAHWRAHLIQDLQPYTCTAQVCTEGDNKPLNTWEEWIVHEQVSHRMEYMCPYNPKLTFETRKMYSEHIAQKHPEEQDELLKPNKIDKSAQLSPRPKSGCPLCSYEAATWTDMDKHLAFHLETFALLSLPLATGLEKDDFRMGSLQLEGGDDDAMQLLDGDAVGALSSLFGTEGELLDEDKNQLPPGEKITFSALEELEQLTDSISKGSDAKEATEQADEADADGGIAVAFSWDAQMLVSVSHKTVKLWNANTAQLLQTLEGHTAPVLDVAFSPDSQLVASVSEDFTMRVWEVATGSCRIVHEVHSDHVDVVTFSPDGRLIASASYDNTVQVWDVATGSCHIVLEGHADHVNAVTFSPDGQLIASASYDNTARVWDAATGSCRSVLVGHSGWVLAVAFSPDFSLIASGSDDRTVRVWDVATGSCRSVLEGHSGWVCTVAFSRDFPLIASGSDDNTVRVWDVATGSRRSVLESDTVGVNAVAFLPNSRVLALALHEKTVQLWDADTGRRMVGSHPVDKITRTPKLAWPTKITKNIKNLLTFRA